MSAPQQPVTRDSWPSEANRADPDFGGESGSTDGLDDSTVRQIYDLVDAVDDDLAGRAVSVTPERMLRREAVREIRGSPGSYKARTVRGVLKAFLKWAVEQLDSKIVFKSDEGDTLKVNLPVSISEDKAREYYARLKDLERAAMYEGERPHTAMLTFTGSTENENGEPRCIVDHLDDVQEAWNPYVRRELQRAMDRAGFDRYDPVDTPARWWEYATIVEPHKSGYAHFHVAIFTSHEIEREMFRRVMQKHVDKCLIAAPEAHRIKGPESAVSVREMDPESDPEGSGTVSNLGSYLAAYIGGFDNSGSGEEFLEKPLHELIFYAACWAANHQRVRFSNGANRLAAVGEELRKSEDDDPEIDPREWHVSHIERPDGSEEPPESGGGVERVPITGSGRADPRPVHSGRIPPPGLENDDRS